MESDSSKNGGNVQMELKLEKSYMDPQLERDVSEAWREFYWSGEIANFHLRRKGD